MSESRQRQADGRVPVLYPHTRTRWRRQTRRRAHIRGKSILPVDGKQHRKAGHPTITANNRSSTPLCSTRLLLTGSHASTRRLLLSKSRRRTVRAQMCAWCALTGSRSVLAADCVPREAIQTPPGRYVLPFQCAVARLVHRPSRSPRKVPTPMARGRWAAVKSPVQDGRSRTALPHRIFSVCVTLLFSSSLAFNPLLLLILAC